ncbi:MAG: PAS domain S-box protein [Thiobacillus sp.]|nr:PAS domain S-box protein [Thiobacillus sp.]
MATSSIPQVKNPLANLNISPRIFNAGMNELPVLTLDDMGVIRDCSHTCEQVFGYLVDELAGRHVSVVLPQLPDTDLVQDGRINARLAYLCHCAVAFQARCRDGRYFTSELFINRLGVHNVVVLVRSLEASIAHGCAMLPGPLASRIY